MLMAPKISVVTDQLWHERRKSGNRMQTKIIRHIELSHPPYGEGLTPFRRRVILPRRSNRLQYHDFPSTQHPQSWAEL